MAENELLSPNPGKGEKYPWGELMPDTGKMLISHLQKHNILMRVKNRNH